MFHHLSDLEKKSKEQFDEIVLIGRVVELLPEYNRRLEAMKRIDFSKFSPQEKIANNMILRNFFEIHQKIESLYRNFPESAGKNAREILNILEEAKVIFTKQLDSFYKMPVTNKVPNVSAEIKK